MRITIKDMSIEIKVLKSSMRAKASCRKTMELKAQKSSMRVKLSQREIMKLKGSKVPIKSQGQPQDDGSKTIDQAQIQYQNLMALAAA